VYYVTPFWFPDKEFGMSDRTSLPLIHAAAGVAGFLIIATFQAATILAEAFAAPSGVAAVKTGVVLGLFALIPAMAVAGATGRRLVGASPVGLAARKLRRLVFAALNGLCVLVPCALFLAYKARGGELDASFAAVQTLELAAGLVNLILLGLNIRDGLILSGRLRRKSRMAHTSGRA
jgi:hypothetical protein